MPSNPQLTQAAAKALNLPDGFKTYSPFPFGGMNSQSSITAFDDKDFYLLENLFRLGDGYLRAGWDVGPPIIDTVGAGSDYQIVSFFFYTIGPKYYCAVFFNNGIAWQMDMSLANPSTAPVWIGGTAGGGVHTFYHPDSGQLPACSQWGTQYLLISNRNTRNDYWVWDGSLLYASGSVAPNGVVLTATGSNYVYPPTVVAVGGTGGGFAGTANIEGGQVVSVDIQNPGTGYRSSDTPQLIFTGGGSDDEAYLVARLFKTSVGSIDVLSEGEGYFTAPTITFGPGFAGSGAAATAVVDGAGHVVSIYMTALGAGYNSAPPVVITPLDGGHGAVAQANLLGSGVHVIVPTTPPSGGPVGGSGYQYPPPLTIIGGGGSGAVAVAVLTATSIDHIDITSGGSGYTSPPTLTITGGGGTTATAVASVTGGAVTAVTVVEGGSGYVGGQASVVFIPVPPGSAASGASANLTIANGVVEKVNILSGGSGYSNPPTVVIVDGNLPSTTAVAHAEVSNGSVSRIVVDNPGAGYTSQPFVASAGGGGTGFTAVVKLVPTSIDKVQVTASGDGYTSAPTVLVGGGANHSAAATLNLMPYGISGSSIETFSQRVWLANPAKPRYGKVSPGGNFAVSAPGTLHDFSLTGGAAFQTSVDSFLQTRYEGLRQSNGYLYFFADGSVSVVSNIQTSGTPPTTTFNYQNVDLQTGLSWRDSRQDFGRSMLIANEAGIYGLYGGSVTKISDKLNIMFDNAVFPGPVTSPTEPSAAIATIHQVKHYMLLMNILDPETGAQRKAMVTWNEKEWIITSQSVNLIYIGTQKVESKFTAWGTDGNFIWPLFQKPSALIQKRLHTKAYGNDSLFVIKDFQRLYMSAASFSGELDMTATLEAHGLATQSANFPSVESGLNAGGGNILYQNPTFPPQPAGILGYQVWGSGSGGLPFCTISLRLSSYTPDFLIANIIIGYTPITAI